MRKIDSHEGGGIVTLSTIKLLSGRTGRSRRRAARKFKKLLANKVEFFSTFDPPFEVRVASRG